MATRTAKPTDLHTIINKQPVGTYYLHIMPKGMSGKRATEAMEFRVVGDDLTAAKQEFFDAIIDCVHRKPTTAKYEAHVQLLRVAANVNIMGTVRPRGAQPTMSWRETANPNFPAVSGKHAYFVSLSRAKQYQGGIHNALRDAYKPLPKWVIASM